MNYVSRQVLLSVTLYMIQKELAMPRTGMFLLRSMSICFRRLKRYVYEE